MTSLGDICRGTVPDLVVLFPLWLDLVQQLFGTPRIAPFAVVNPLDFAGRGLAGDATP